MAENTNPSAPIPDKNLGARSDADSQRIEALNSEDSQRLLNQRGVIERYLGDGESNHQKYQTAAGKLGLLRALLDADVFSPSQTYELQCLGIVFGDALVQECGVEWRAVEDQFGRDPCVVIPGTTLVVFPLTMISKRIEKGGRVDVFDLFNWTAAKIGELRGTVDRS